MLVVWLLVLLFGLAVGSFLNVVVVRMIQGGSALKGRSECPKCKTIIAWYDNIPLLSFVVLKGKCRRCGKRISWQYPALEFLTGVLFVWWYAIGDLFFRLQGGPYKVVQPVFWLVVGVGMMALTVADLFYGLLPDLFTASLTVLTFLYRFALTITGIMELGDFLMFIVSGAGAGLFFYLLVVVTKGKGMGLGDVKLALLMGLLLGWQKTVVALMAAFLTGAAVGAILIVLKKKRFGQTIPFGPFMILGTAVALLWGQTWWQWYVERLYG